MHWAHRIKDSDTLDVVRDDYLFGSSNVRIQHSNISTHKRGLWKTWERGLWEENSADLERGFVG